MLKLTNKSSTIFWEKTKFRDRNKSQKDPQNIRKVQNVQIVTYFDAIFGNWEDFEIEI